MFTKILVAVSPNSADTVLASAIETARKHDARIVALHVVDPSPCMTGPMDYDIGLVLNALEAHGREFAARVATLLDEHGCDAESRTITLPVAGHTIGRAIASAAESSGADLILLGPRKAAWWRWLSEDVASQVRRHTDTPIQSVQSRIGGGATQREMKRWSQVPAAGAR